MEIQCSEVHVGIGLDTGIGIDIDIDSYGGRLNATKRRNLVEY